MDSILIRFPDGTKEFRFPGKELAEGDIVWHEGQGWRIVSISLDGGDHSVAVVESASDGLVDKLLSEEGAIRLEVV